MGLYAVAETFAKAAGRGVNRVQCGKDYFKDDSGTCVPRIQISIPNGNGMPEWPAWPSTDTDEDSDNDDQINEIKESSDEPNGNLTSSEIVQKNMTNQIQNPSVIGGKEKDENLNNQRQNSSTIEAEQRTEQIPVKPVNRKSVEVEDADELEDNASIIIVSVVIIICIFSYIIARRKRQGNYLFSYPGDPGHPGVLRNQHGSDKTDFLI